VKLRTLASSLTHLLFVSLIVLGATKHFEQTRGADAHDVLKTAPETSPLPERRSAPRFRASRDGTPPVSTGSNVVAGHQGTDIEGSPEREGDSADTGETEEATTSVNPHGPAEPPDATGIQPHTKPESPHARLMRRLVAAYPDFLAGFEGNQIIWRDGTRMLFDDGRDKTFMQRLTEPDLQDQFYTAYPRGLRGVPPLENLDPGRVRYQPFFTKMYGDCTNDGADVRANLVDVIWLPDNWGKTLRVTRVNGVAEALRKVSAALDKLPKRFMKYLRPSAGTYNCRAIAGTKRLSVHAFGAAIDINVNYADYWRWRNADPGEPLAHRNRIPWDIVEIFERHGFIWGGKWYHYDTMHFEYRPELLTPPPSEAAPAEDHAPPSPDQRAAR